MYTLREIASITGASLSGPDRQVDSYLTDSRNVQSASGALFFALQTPRNDGHRYIPSLIRSGVKAFVVKSGFDSAGMDADISFLHTPDPLECLQTLAAHHRKQFNIPVIGITGSNGKTIVKEWLYQLLKDKYTICRSPKSFNSQIGVPLSVLLLRSGHNLAIFEAGISLPGEMEKLERIIRPDIGILTSFGTAHDEGFQHADKLSEKLRLFGNSATVIVNGVERDRLDTPGNIILVSNHDTADVKYEARGEMLRIQIAKDFLETRLPFADAASQANAATCAALLSNLGLPSDEISQKLSRLQPVALRLELKAGMSNSVLINDFYNSDLDSLRIALQFLQQQKQRQKKTVILSDIEQSGLDDDTLYRNVSELLKTHGITSVIGVGEGIGAHKNLFPEGTQFFRDTTELVSSIRSITTAIKDAIVLLKGARSFGFEKLSQLLQQKSHDTVFEIDLNRLAANVNYYRSLLGPGVRMMGMVKAMGYGSGSAEVAALLEHMGMSHLAVAYADEGVELRQSGITVPVMVMNPERDAYQDIIAYNLEPEIYSLRLLDEFASEVDNSGATQPWPVHIKIDTGMHRLGFMSDEIKQLAERLASTPQLRVASVFSHLAASDAPQLDDFTRSQIRAFDDACSMLKAKLGYGFLRHICNSGGITRFPEAHYDMVRIGIGMYGVGVNVQEQGRLQNVGTLRTRISQIKHLKAGETVGYSRKGKLSTDASIAVIPIGYADGFLRQLGNGAFSVTIKGKQCPTVGNICMDMCMVDVTGVNCMEHDEVIIFGDTAQISAMAAALGTISYEVLTSVSSRVKRIYVQE